MASTRICLSQFPLDVLLYTLSFAGLLDNLAFSMVCKATFSLSSERTFWISALQNERLIRPIACPTHEDLTEHDLHSLRRIALHTLRLQQNLSSEKPCIMGDTKRVDLGLSTHDNNFRVPGTELYIFDCPDRGTLELWHVGWRCMVGEPIRASPRIFDVSSGVDLPGKFMMAFLSIMPGIKFQVSVVCVEYGPTHAALKLVLQHELVGRFHWGIYLDEDLVGTLCRDPLSHHGLYVFAINLSTRKETLIETDLPSLEAPLRSEQINRAGTVVVDGDLCILIAEPCAKSWIFTVPRSLLLQSNSPNSLRDSTPIFKSNFAFFDGHSRENGNPDTLTVTTNTMYGIQAMTIYSPPPYGDSNPVFTDVVFWVQPRLSGHKNAPAPLVPLALNGIPGTLFSPSDSNFWQHIFQTFSGKYGIIMSNVAEEEGSGEKQIVRLLSCNPEATNPITYRDLTLPDFLVASRVHGLSIDDHLGVVSLIDSDGVLHAIPYA